MTNWVCQAAPLNSYFFGLVVIQCDGVWIRCKLGLECGMNQRNLSKSWSKECDVYKLVVQYLFPFLAILFGRLPCTSI